MPGDAIGPAHVPSRPPAPGAAASPPSVTELLVAWSAGDAAARDALISVVYAELRRRARIAIRREGAGHTLNPTGLVHEVYLRLVDQRQARWQNRAQFYGVAVTCMHRILVDHARARRAVKRGDGDLPDALHHAEGVAASDTGADHADLVLAVDDALTRLAVCDPRQAQVVVMRYFGGLTIEETADALGIAPATVKRDWDVARLWLARELREYR